MSEHQIFGHSHHYPKAQKLHGHQVYTGFPNQASDNLRPDLDFNEYLGPNKASTFTIKVSGHSMNEAHIHDGDLLVVDRSKNPCNGSIIVAVINNEFAVKIFYKKNNQIFLLPKKTGGKTTMISPEDDFQVWGIVTFIIHDARVKE